jgi:tetratricopeptide (TPR) repeat protein
VVQLDERRIDDALTSLRNALAIKRELARRLPKDRDRRLDVAQALAWLSDAELLSNGREAAMQNRREEQAIYRTMLDETPDDRPTIEALIVNRDRIAQILLDDGKIQPSLTELEQAVSEAEPLLKLDPSNVEYRGAALGAFLLQGEAYLQARLLVQAATAASRARELVEGLAKMAPNVIDWNGTQLGAVRLLQTKVAAANARDLHACVIALAPADRESQRLDRVSTNVPSLSALARVAAEGDLLRGDYAAANTQPDLARTAWSRALNGLTILAGTLAPATDPSVQRLLADARTRLQSSSLQIKVDQVRSRRFSCGTL